MHEYSEKVQRNLKEICNHFDKEDREVRERQVRTWKKLKFYWQGFQRLWWSEEARDWRIFDSEFYDESNEQSAYYDKPLNIFKAYLESIIAAMSVQIPGIKCFPDDADSPLDNFTAKSGDKIAKLIYRHNDAVLLWLHALYIFCTEGMVAAYSYTKEDKEFGTYKVNRYEEVVEEKEIPYCPQCDKEIFQANIDEMTGEEICPHCFGQADMKSVPFTYNKIVGETDEPKSRQIIECYGGLFVKVPNYARCQKDAPYLIFSYETHYSNVLARFDHLRGTIGEKVRESAKNYSIYDSYDRWGRLSTQYRGDDPRENVTVRNCWLRPSSFEIIREDDDVDELKELFPDGVKVVLVNDEYATAEPEKLDDHWTLTYNPLSDYIHFDPLGLFLVSAQDIINDIVSLALQTIEHGIPQTFADPKVLNFDQYRQTEVAPGSVFPAKPPAGKSLDQSFFQVKTANLSGEVLPFAQQIQQLAQLVSGALPSLFGGAAEAGSKTAAEYSMSRAQALQRLQTPWKMFSIWWKTIFGKVIQSFIDNLETDERFVDRDQNGNFYNILIKKAELEGKIGNIELEASEQLPIMWQANKDVILQLMQLNNPAILQALTSPENLSLISSAIGIPEFKLPGEDDRNKQYEEIKLLANSSPIELPGMEEPSVPIDPLIDNHMVHAEICRSYLVSDVGRQLKIDNEEGYRNILLHLERHVQAATAQTAPGPQPAVQGEVQ